MSSPMIGGLLVCALGVLLAFGNDAMTRAVCKRKPSLLVPFFAARQIVNIAYLAALYFLSPALPWGATPLLVGGALGVTVPSVFLASRLAKRVGEEKQASDAPENAASTGKEKD